MNYSSDLAGHWALDPDVIFLNHGSFGACPREILNRQQALRARLEREPVTFLARDFEELLDGARRELTAFIGAKPNYLAFVPNATTAVNTILRSWPICRGDEILITNQTYRACGNAAEFIAQRRGAKCVCAEIPFSLESEELAVRAILDRVTPRTRLALLDHISSATSLIFPIGRLVRELKALGVETLVDGAHGPGMVPLEVEAIGAAFYTGNCHKWLCSPKGAAFLHVRDDLLDRIRPLVVSHGATDPRPDRNRFHKEFDWTGTHDPTPYLCVAESIRFLGSLIPGGWREIMDRNHRLAVRARDILCASLGVTHPCPDDMIGAMSSIPLPDYAGLPPSTHAQIDPLQDLLFHRYSIEAVVTPWPDADHKLLRVSAHLHNAPRQYEILGEAIEEIFSEYGKNRGGGI